MPLPNQLLESLWRRNSLKGLLWIWISAISGMTQARMNQVLGTQNISNGKLSLMSQERLLDLVDEAESLLRKKMPEGTKNEDIRFFAIVPDRENIMKKDIIVYNGKLVPQYDKSWRQKWKKIQIIDGNWLAQFPNAEIIKGRWVGARIKLNDPNYIILYYR